MLTIIAFLVTFSILVLVHELGHFFAARLAGVHVEEFGFGFPPRLAGRMFGRTLYTLNLIPLGGFVKLFGESDKMGDQNDASRVSFSSQSFGKKMMIVLSGVGSNWLLSVIMFSFLLSIGTPQLLTRLYPYATVTHRRLVVTQVLPGSPAEVSGLKMGDMLASVAKTNVTTVEELQKLLAPLADTPVRIDLERKRKPLTLEITPRRLDDVEGRVALGIFLEPVATIAYPLLLSPVYAAAETWFLSGEMLEVLQNMIGKIFRERTVEGLGVTGPIGIAVLSGRVARQGMPAFVYFIALLSLNLALINILPLPALDGGRGAILLGERLVGKKLNRKLEVGIQSLGIVLILLLVLLVTVEDVRTFAPAFVRAFR